MATEESNAEKLLLKLSLHFFKSSLNFFLKADDIELMTWTWQQKFLDTTINSQLLKKYPVRNKFSRVFIKKLIGYLEGCQDVHDDLYMQLCLVMNDSKNDDFSHRHYVIGNNLSDIVTIKETNNMVVNGTTGLRTWEAALMLSDWALCNKQVFANKKVIELGSGVGFTGITIGKCCKPQSLVLTDCHNDVLNTIKDNIQINFPYLKQEENNNMIMFNDEELSMGVMTLDWNEAENIPPELVPDVIVGADIVYDPSILIPLCNVLQIFFSKNNELEIYIASVIRNENTFQQFLETLANINFGYEEIILRKSVYIDWDVDIQRCLIKIRKL